MAGKQPNLPQGQSDSNQFGLGLLLGFFVGFSSYFLFKSEEGGRLRKAFQEHWQEAADELPSLQEIKIGDLLLGELIGLLLGTSKPRSTKGSGLKIKSSTRTMTKEKQDSPKKFKGV